MTRTILITGAGTGIGRATADRFAREGERVLLIGRRSNVLEDAANWIRSRTSSADIAQYTADMSDPEAVMVVANQVTSEWGHVDAIVCCAGSGGLVDGESLSDVESEWNRAMRSNVLTAALTIEAFRETLSDDGSIVLVSSIAAYRGSGGTGAYGASKAALHSYAHTLASQLGPRGVNVNVVAPGYVSDTEFFGDVMTDARRTHLVSQTALGRAGTPEDIAETNFFLCSTAANYITSQVLQINGGSNHGV